LNSGHQPILIGEDVMRINAGGKEKISSGPATIFAILRNSVGSFAGNCNAKKLFLVIFQSVLNFSHFS